MMRLRSLDLTRYGRFTDARLPFGPRNGDTPDLHIVYGDNEAGKTTMLNAFVDLLFGIEASTPYKFLHPATAMKVGGSLELDGGVHDVERPYKSAALLAADGRPLPDGIFSPHLAGLDRSAYRMMFSLDETTLIAGGESILASKGDLGQLLFSASAGLSDFSAALAGLRAQADAFYRLHARKHDLADLKKALADLKARKGEIDVLAAPFARLVAQREAAEAAYASASEERAATRAALASVRRQLVVLPRLAEWRSVRDEHASLPDVASVPPGWAEDVPTLRTEEIELQTKRTALNEDHERLSREIESLALDEPALRAAPRLRATADLRARHTTAVKDLPDRRMRLRAAEADIAAILQDIGRPGETAHALVLRGDTTERLRQSIEALSGIRSALAEADREVRAAGEQVAEAEAAVAALGPSYEEGAAAVLVALAAADRDDSDARVRLCEQQLRTRKDAVETRLAALAGWHGSVDELTAQTVPTDRERRDLADALASAEASVKETTRDLEGLDVEIARLTAEAAALEGDATLIKDAEAKTNRAARDAAWFAHKERLDAASAADFETAMRQDDAIAAVRLGTAGALADMRTLHRTLAGRRGEYDRISKRLSTAASRLAAAKAAIADCVRPLGLTEDAGLAALEAFIGRRQSVLDAHDADRNALRDLDDATRDNEAARERLRAAISEANRPTDTAMPLEALKRSARQILEQVADARLIVKRRNELRAELGLRRRQFEVAKYAHDAWSSDWREAVGSTWLRDADAAYARRILPHLSALGAAVDRHDDLAGRIAKMESDQGAFAEAIAAIATDLKVAKGSKDQDPMVLADDIQSRIDAALASADRRDARCADRDDATTRLQAVEHATAILGRRIEDMKARFRAADLADVAEAMATRARKDGLAARLRALALEILASVPGANVEEVDESFSTLDRAALEQSEAQLEAASEHQEARLRVLFAARVAAQDAVVAVGADEEAARLEEERRTLLLEIEERGLAHLSMRSGIIAAEQAVRLYRERHRGSMMIEASNLFARLSRGAYAGLAAQSTKDGEVLVGLPSGGGSKLATEMSTATRNQLYLALRIAGYREFTKTRGPVPLVLDDVLETFDNPRTEASLSLLADIARVGQVIYLTHHHHVCEIATSVCPSASLHDLGALH